MTVVARSLYKYLYQLAITSGLMSSYFIPAAQSSPSAHLGCQLRAVTEGTHTRFYEKRRGGQGMVKKKTIYLQEHERIHI